MKTIVLPFETQALLGVNRKIIISWKDFKSWQDSGTAITSTTAQAIWPENTIGAVTKTFKAGTRLSNFLVNLTVAFTGATLSAFVLGDGTTANKYATTFDAAGAVAWKAVGVATPVLLAAAGYIAMTATSDGPTNLTAGEIEIYFKEEDLTVLPMVQQPGY